MSQDELQKALDAVLKEVEKDTSSEESEVELAQRAICW